MKKATALAVVLCLLISLPLAFSKDAPKKEEKKSASWSDKVGQLLQSVKGAGKWASDLVAKLTGKMPDKKDADKAKKDVKKSGDKADKALKKSADVVKKKADSAADALKKAAKKLTTGATN